MIKEFFNPATTFRLAVHTTAQTLTTAQKCVPPGMRARVTVETAPIRVAFGGATAQASTTGHYYDINDEFFIFGHEALDSSSWIRGGATDGVVQITVMHEDDSRKKS